MRYAFIQNHQEAIPVDLMCQVLEVGKSGFYAWLKRPESLRNRENQQLLIEIRRCINAVVRPTAVPGFMRT